MRTSPLLAYRVSGGMAWALSGGRIVDHTPQAGPRPGRSRDVSATDDVDVDTAAALFLSGFGPRREAFGRGSSPLTLSRCNLTRCWIPSRRAQGGNQTCKLQTCTTSSGGSA